ncbi:hypothetical protein QQF64_020415 [Cirrhinus molitorella]|uniref:PiggyBac transposable element-derived protein domain-containing protein n=1 Tax=Cirrhinus molitorella TaxID=172907 RepID=A0ABR3L941_9TELE
MIDLIVSMTNLHERRTMSNWTGVDSTDLRAYKGLMILAGIYRSRGESTRCLWDDHSGPAETSSSQRGQVCAHQIPVGNVDASPSPPLQPGKDVTVDEQLVPFKGRCSFWEYI